MAPSSPEPPSPHPGLRGLDTEGRRSGRGRQGVGRQRAVNLSLAQATPTAQAHGRETPVYPEDGRREIRAHARQTRDDHQDAIAEQPPNVVSSQAH